MLETPGDLEHLQRVIDVSIERAGTFLRSAFEMPDKSLTAAELTGRIDGLVNVAFATVTAGGEPRVAPIGAVLVRGHFHIPTVGSAARVAHIERTPAVSCTVYEGVDFAVIIHGRAGFLRPHDDGYVEVESTYRDLTGADISSWGDDPLFIRIEPVSIFTFDRFR